MTGEDYITRSFVISTHQIYLNDQIKKNEMGGAHGMYGGLKRCIQDLGGEN